MTIIKGFFNMYKLLIVDDEKIVIEGLKSATNWKEHNIEIVGAASDGEEALKEITNKQPDIVLADIRMPKMNGLDLIKETKNLNLETVFIIISGYSKFDYAKRAIQLEAIDYLVKPIEVDEIIDSIKNAILKLEKIKSEKQTTERINEYQVELEEKRVLDYILGHRSVDPEKDHRLKTFSFFNIGLKGYSWEDSKETEKLQVLLGHLKNLLDNRGIESFIYTIDSQIVIMFSNSSLDISNDLIQDLLTLIFHDIKIRPNVGISNSYENISEIKKAYSEAKEALKNGIFRNRLVTYYFDLETYNHSFGNSIIEEINQFFKESSPDLLSRISPFIDKVFLDCKKSNLSPEKSKYLCFKMVNHCLEYIESEYEIKNIGGERYLLYEELNLLQSLEEIRVWLEQFIAESTVFFNENHVSYNEKFIIDLKSFINTHYNEPIVLDDLGKLFHKNPAYLCSLFSKAVGITLFEYITNIRLNNAKKLLRTTNLKVFEICKQVGYENQKYFNQVFKKNIGTTPGLYRSQHIIK